jgi:hypothetical protein
LKQQQQQQHVQLAVTISPKVCRLQYRQRSTGAVSMDWSKAAAVSDYAQLTLKHKC